MKKFLAIMLALALLAGVACSAPATQPDTGLEPEITEAPTEITAEPEPDPTEEPTPEPEPTPMPDMEVTSASITDGALGLAYGDKGEQFIDSWIPSLSPQLTVNYIPEGTKSLALTMIDPDGGYWVHWLVCNMVVEETGYKLPENASIDMAESFVQGKNDFGPIGYGGPTPPSGVHNYIFTVYALSDTLPLENGFTLPQLQAAMVELILAEAVITGTYSR